jgi:hypothetical protein
MNSIHAAIAIERDRAGGRFDVLCVRIANLQQSVSPWRGFVPRDMLALSPSGMRKHRVSALIGT